MLCRLKATIEHLIVSRESLGKRLVLHWRVNEHFILHALFGPLSVCEFLAHWERSINTRNVSGRLVLATVLLGCCNKSIDVVFNLKQRAVFVSAIRPRVLCLEFCRRWLIKLCELYMRWEEVHVWVMLNVHKLRQRHALVWLYWTVLLLPHLRCLS